MEKSDERKNVCEWTAIVLTLNKASALYGCKPIERKMKQTGKAMKMHEFICQKRWTQKLKKNSLFDIKSVLEMSIADTI